MKTNIKHLFLFCMFIFISINTFAYENPYRKHTLSSTSEKSLLKGISSENEGLIVSSTNLLGDLQSSASVIPLMKLLKSNENEKVRVAAAQALIKIGDSRGVFAVQQASKLDDNDYVRTMCAKFMRTVNSK